MDVEKFFDQEIDEHLDVAILTRSSSSLRKQFVQLVKLSKDSVKRGNKIVFFGNGGSAADAQHLATELACRYSQDRKPIAGLALTTDTSLLTAIGNDYGFKHNFERQVLALCRKGDVAIGITTSGKSENVILALRAAKKIGMIAAAFGAGNGGNLKGLAKPLLLVPSKITARIQEAHIMLGQMFCSALEQELNLV
ncbi:MAG: SIS domain-containing protein [Pseudomonadota bacterium]|nr:SIS domain-containing protein [Pseudomonadota bacterium]MEC8876090.1 SIS domain-containing protein [Pseudomonadota bacterium]MEC8877143.1 SIS domain-containing protein [Pseudomonadota bacterium]MED5339860.1 SIS domain-containing protein [Pseudomonadota bacterium]